MAEQITDIAFGKRRMRADPAPAGLQPVRFRARGFQPTGSRSGSLIAFAATLGIWQLATAGGWINPLFLPSPLDIAEALYQLAASGELWRHVSASAGRVALGCLIGISAGMLVGFAMGLWNVARSIGLAYVSALFPIPKIALLPLLILWLGIGESSKVATLALGVFFPTVISVYTGVDSVPRNLIRMAQSFDMPFMDILRKVVFPGALPSILAGLRISTSFALLLVVSAEMIGADHGIGTLILQAGNLMQTDRLLAGVCVLSIFGLSIAKGLGALERRILHWR